MNYYVRKHEDKFVVKEQKTNFVVRVFKKHELAAKFAKRLNSGGAFNGETPNFFIKKEEQYVLEHD